MTGVAALEIVPATSAVLVEARSSVGRISFGSTELRGALSASIVDRQVDATQHVTARLVIPVASLVSGNAMYDRELRMRLNAQRYPDITAELEQVRDLGSGRMAVAGQLTLRDAVRDQSGTASVTVTEAPAEDGEGRLSVVVDGTTVVDMRDFDIELPSVLMLKIYPEVSVRFRVTATAGDPTGDGGN